MKCVYLLVLYKLKWLLATVQSIVDELSQDTSIRQGINFTGHPEVTALWVMKKNGME